MTTKPAVEIDLDKQRAEFEAWLGRPMMNPDHPTHYNGRDVRIAWGAWQAAQARASQAVAEPVAWMNPDEVIASDAFRWVQPAHAPEYSVPVYRAAPVAQQSEATLSAKVGLRCVLEAIEGSDRDARLSNMDAPKLIRAAVAALSQATEAGAPTAAAEQWKRLFWNVAQALHCLPSTYVDGNAHVLEQALKYANLAKFEAGREIAEPLAKQDVKLRKQVVEALTDAKTLLELNGITLDDDCDYGNGRADDIIGRMDKAVSAMQKGTSNG